jgi:trimethylamine--corrinoid protein Co-methyltransferase
VKQLPRNLHAGFSRIDGFGVNVLSQDEISAIHLATLDVLEHVGVRVDSEEAREIYAGGGARVNPWTKIVKIPPYMVEDALRWAPSTLLLAARDSQKDYIMESNRVGFVNFGEGVNIIDPVTRKYRASNKEDVAHPFGQFT